MNFALVYDMICVPAKKNMLGWWFTIGKWWFIATPKKRRKVRFTTFYLRVLSTWVCAIFAMTKCADDDLVVSWLFEV